MNLSPGQRRRFIFPGIRLRNERQDCRSPAVRGRHWRVRPPDGGLTFGAAASERAMLFCGGYEKEMEKSSLRAEDIKKNRTQKGIALSGDGSFGASMTVEAALVLPLFLFFIFNVLFLFDVVRLQSSMTGALQQAGDRICEYAWYREYAGDQAGGRGNLPEIPGGDFLSMAFVAGEVRSSLGSGYLNNTCLRGGASGISYLHSNILSGNDIVEINADYRTRPFIPVLSGPDFSIRSTYYAHAWTGYEIGSGTGGQEGGEQEEAPDDPVIVAENGVVYHRDPDCVYLKPHVRQVDGADLGRLRANDGSIYHPCEYCHPSPDGTVYITPDGNRYHSSPDCSRISRTTHQETAEEAAKHLRPCPKCGGMH